MLIQAYMKEIEALLHDELPELAASLLPPASESDIRRVEAEIGLPFPEPLRELYLLHNGESDTGPGLFYGLRFLPLDNVLEQWRVWAGLEADYGFEGDHYSIPSGWIKEQYIHKAWLPISEDGGGNHLGVDLAPDEQGIRGQVINFGRDEEKKYVIAKQVTHLLQFMRDEVQAGHYSVEEEDEFKHWIYSHDHKPYHHFLDALHTMELPVIEPYKSSYQSAAGKLDMESLDGAWKERLIQKGLTLEALYKAKTLYFIREGLTDISPLGGCREVRELILSANQLRDITPLSGCEQLKKLYLVGNPVSNLLPLQHLPHLQILNISKTEVRDISVLASFPKLKELEVEETQIDDYSPLASIRGLRSLFVSSLNANQLRSLSKVKSLTHLSVTSLDPVDSDAIALLGELSQLKSLHLEDVRLANFDFLLACTKLTELTLKETVVADISALAQLSNLKTIKLEGSEQIGNLESLAQSTSIQIFTGSFQQFDALKHKFQQKVDFSTIIGSMTEEQSEVWHDFLR